MISLKELKDTLRGFLHNGTTYNTDLERHAREYAGFSTWTWMSNGRDAWWLDVLECIYDADYLGFVRELAELLRKHPDSNALWVDESWKVEHAVRLRVTPGYAAWLNAEEENSNAAWLEALEAAFVEYLTPPKPAPDSLTTFARHISGHIHHTLSEAADAFEQGDLTQAFTLALLAQQSLTEFIQRVLLARLRTNTTTKTV